MLPPINHLILDSPRILVGSLALIELGRHDRLVLLVVVVEAADVRLELTVHLLLEPFHVELEVGRRCAVELIELLLNLRVMPELPRDPRGEATGVLYLLRGGRLVGLSGQHGTQP